MKLTKVFLMVSLALFPRLLAANEFDLNAQLGEHWYGLYFNGQKAGYALNAVTRGDHDTIVFAEDVRFRINMNGRNQDMHILSKRIYDGSGNLMEIESRVDDSASRSTFEAHVDGNDMLLKTTVGGRVTEERLPKPNETLQDAFKQTQLVGKQAKLDDEIAYTLFDPIYKKEIKAVSRIVGIEPHVFEGAPTKLYQIKSHVEIMNIDMMSYVTEEGVTIEDVVAGIITMRLEPEKIAQDVDYSNDVIVSNAALIDKPLTNLQQRPGLNLRLEGPLTQEHLFNDERQSMQESDAAFHFVSKRISTKGLRPVALPVAEPSVQEWLAPTTFVQSDDPRLIAKAREIVAGETDAIKASERLCEWVYRSVHTVFSARLTNALEVLESLEGDCTEHSVLFVGLARAAGLPAREVAGLVYVNGPQPGFYFHQWAKVWVGKWIDVDPTFNQPLADITHIKLAEGDLLTQTKLVPIIGRIKITNLDSAGK